MRIRDFNEIMSSDEKSGSLNKAQILIKKFQDAIPDAGLHDMGFMGNKLTRIMNRDDGLIIREQLDRTIVSSSWKKLFPYGRK